MLTDFTDGDFERIHKAHWNIERFHRATKQLCSIEKFQVRTTECIKNHIFRCEPWSAKHGVSRPR
ncbi:transposase [Piscirickettsia salmonis]|nr:transposase [Piscirickettsia salmonis]